MREQRAWLVFEDESGQSLRLPKARTWSRIGCSPQGRMSGKGSGRISLAGMVCELLAARDRWLTVFRLPAYAPDLNPAEGVWANLHTAGQPIGL